MKHEFLAGFPRRMKHVGMYAVLMRNSMMKTTWKTYGIEQVDDQVNLLFAVMLFIMEYSLRELNCTMDDIAAFLDEAGAEILTERITFEKCRELAEFVVNTILCDEGRAMYFKAHDFETRKDTELHISYLNSRVVYEGEIRRTSYSLTDDGYNLLLSTLEIENNLKLTVQEMIFQLQLEKAAYDKALDAVKNIFHLIRIQLQRIDNAAARIRRNALSYSVAEYREILTENMDTITSTQKKFEDYRNVVRMREKDLEDRDIHIKRLTEKEKESLENLRQIEGYLSGTLEAQQSVMNRHLALKELYTKQLEAMSQVSLIKRYAFRAEVYDRVLAHPLLLNGLDDFLSPLFIKGAGKIYNPEIAAQYQRVLRGGREDDDEAYFAFDDEDDEDAAIRRYEEKMRIYEGSLKLIMERAHSVKGVTLKELQRDESVKDTLIPTIEVFREIVIELLKSGEIDINALLKERMEYISDRSEMFQLNESILRILDADSGFGDVSTFTCYRTAGSEVVSFYDAPEESGRRRTMHCSNVVFHLV